MQDKISLRQFVVLLTVALLSPLIKIVPGEMVAFGGPGCWLGSLLVLPVALLIIWLIGRIGQSLPENDGLADAFCHCFGNILGRIICITFGIWLVLLSCVDLRFFVERMTSTIYPDTGTAMILLVFLALEWWLGRQSFAVTARTGQVFFFAVVLTFALMLIMCIWQIRPYNVWPFWFDDLPGIALGGARMMSGLGMAMGALLLFGKVSDRRGGTKLAMAWTTGLCLTLTVLGFAITGIFGTELTQQFQSPFFSLAKEVRIEGVIERAEPLVVTVWIFTDLILVATFLRSAQCAFCQAFQLSEFSITSPLLTIVLPGTFLIAGSSFSLQSAYAKWFLWGDGIFFFALPLLTAVVGKVRRVL